MAEVSQEKPDMLAQIAAAIEANFDEQTALFERTFADLDNSRAKTAPRPKPVQPRPVMTDAERAQRQDEQRMIVTMTADGTINAEEGRKLLAALDESYGLTPPLPPTQPNPTPARTLRLRVVNPTNGQTVANVGLPLPMIEFGLNVTSRLGSRLPPTISLQGQRIELADVIARVRRGEQGRLFGLTTDKGDVIEIAVE